MNAALLKAAKAVSEQISAVHRAFGAPGDYGYETSQGEALFGLYKAQAEICVAIHEIEGRQ